MNTDFAPDLTWFVTTFLVLDVLAVALLVGVVATAAGRFTLRHRSIRLARHERVLPYYGHLASGH